MVPLTVVAPDDETYSNEPNDSPNMPIESDSWLLWKRTGFLVKE
jgi:hypothetical protein